MLIYLDSEFTCHLTDTGGLQAVETDVFDGKCDKYIEGYRFVPEGQTWTRDDGVQFIGPMVSPYKDYDILAAYQEQYQSDGEMAEQAQVLQSQISELDAAYREGVNSI